MVKSNITQKKIPPGFIGAAWGPMVYFDTQAPLHLQGGHLIEFKNILMQAVTH